MIVPSPSWTQGMEPIVSTKNPHDGPTFLRFEPGLWGLHGKDTPCGSHYLREPRWPAAKATSEVLSVALDRKVVLQSKPPRQPVLQQYHPDLKNSGGPERITIESMLATTFFDLSVLHLLTTATLRRLEELHPPGQFFRATISPQLRPGDPIRKE